MKFREHRRTLEESLTTMVELGSLEALMTHLQKFAEPWPTFPKIDASTVTFIANGTDSRLPDWRNTYIVTLKNYGVLGYLGEVLPGDLS